MNPPRTHQHTNTATAQATAPRPPATLTRSETPAPEPAPPPRHAVPRPTGRPHGEKGERHMNPPRTHQHTNTATARARSGTRTRTTAPVTAPPGPPATRSAGNTRATGTACIRTTAPGPGGQEEACRMGPPVVEGSPA
ncbi:hypothetical protein [Streptomyces sp. NPDC047841]|uniref:hypothetical protein n=1 Tax=Streptomyces sp. NPDC047841 TaxID=3154708 RepID=UPI00345597F6